MEEIADIPREHKQTEVGVIPEDWEVKALGELVLISKAMLFTLRITKSLEQEF